MPAENAYLKNKKIDKGGHLLVFKLFSLIMKLKKKKIVD